MKTNSTVGLSVEEAWAEAEAELAGSAPEAATSGKSEEATSAPIPEHPAVPNESDEDVDLLSGLDDADEEEGGEQPEGDSQTFTVNGEPVPISELTKGYMRQSDYTKKTQELAEKERELEKAQTLYEAMQTDPVGTLNALQAAVRNGQAPAVPPKQENDLEALVAAKVQEMLGKSPEVQQVKSAAEQKVLDETFGAIEKDFGLSKSLTANDRNRVIEKAKELGITDPAGYRVVFGGLLQEAQLRQAKRQQLKNVSSTSGRGTSGEESNDSDEEITDFWSAAQAAAKELGLESLLK